MTKILQDEFEADYCEHAHRLPDLVKNCRLSNGSYGDPCIAKAWHWFRRSREMLVVELPDYTNPTYGGDHFDECQYAADCEKAIESLGLKVKT